jgi:hypothetical protein
MGGFGVCSIYPLAGSFDRNNEPLGSVMGGGFIKCLSDYYLCNRASAPWTYIKAMERSIISPSFLISLKLFYFPLQLSAHSVYRNVGSDNVHWQQALLAKGVGGEYSSW